MTSAPPSPDLSPLDVFAASTDLVPLRPSKPAGQTTLDFSGLLTNHPLLLHEDLRAGCGGQLWPAGTLLAKFLLLRKEEWRGKTIIELGAGGGLVGLALALALHSHPPPPQQSPPTPPMPILITDLPALHALQEKNISLNNLPATAIRASPLPWGTAVPITSFPELDPAYHRPDIILAADCVYFEPAFPLLLETLGELLGSNDSNKEGSGGRGGVCYFSMKKRRKADMRFVRELKKKFEVVDLAGEVSVMRERAEDERGVFLYEVRRKRKKLR